MPQVIGWPQRSQTSGRVVSILVSPQDPTQQHVVADRHVGPIHEEAVTALGHRDLVATYDKLGHCLADAVPVLAAGEVQGEADASVAGGALQCQHLLDRHMLHSTKIRSSKPKVK